MCAVVVARTISQTPSMSLPCSQLRVGLFRAQNRGPELEIEQRRRASGEAAVRRRCEPAVRRCLSRACIRGRRSRNQRPRLDRSIPLGPGPWWTCGPSPQHRSTASPSVAPSCRRRAPLDLIWTIQICAHHYFLAWRRRQPPDPRSTAQIYPPRVKPTSYRSAAPVTGHFAKRALLLGGITEKFG
jgi:hypothetical protein